MVITHNYEELARYIPLRLTTEERNFLKILISALKVSEYTAKVDTTRLYKKDERMVKGINEICAIISGLLVSENYKAGLKKVKGKKILQNGKMFQVFFEIGRRYKIMNPQRMRIEYGKMIYMLQDSTTRVSEEVEMELTKSEIKTVYSELKKHGALDMLKDTLFAQAMDDSQKIPTLVEKYKRKIPSESIQRVLYSIKDADSFLKSNVKPIDEMINYLRKYFDPENPKNGFSLRIQSGYGGACLSHSHKDQFHYVLQSLTLWKNIIQNLFKFWILTERDLFTSSYRLRDTGQGLNRMQAAPSVGGEMSRIISKTQREVEGHWRGITVVHLGDRDVPNALIFIDKYNQVPRIINPIVLAIRSIDSMTTENKGLANLVNNFYGGVEPLKKVILRDFFRHGFDGSGDDGGSCIDGRLTSAWNWCSRLQKKKYYSIFKLSGFIGFDGEFSK